MICCDLPHGESSGTSSPDLLQAGVELDDDNDGGGPDPSCCYEFVQPCDSPDCEDDTICDDEECVISLSVPPCAGCGEARLERRASTSRGGAAEGDETAEGGDHVHVHEGQGQVLECVCGFQDSWECTLDGRDYGALEQYVSLSC